MENLLSLISEYWYLGLVLTLNIFWWLIVFIEVLVQSTEEKNFYPLYNYRNFWQFAIKLDDTSIDNKGWKLFLYWFVVALNILSGFFLWGYILALLFHGVGSMITLLFYLFTGKYEEDN